MDAIPSTPANPPPFGGQHAAAWNQIQHALATHAHTHAAILCHALLAQSQVSPLIRGACHLALARFDGENSLLHAIEAVTTLETIVFSCVSNDEEAMTLSFLLSQAREMVDEVEEDDQDMEEGDGSQSGGSEDEEMEDCDGDDDEEEAEFEGEIVVGNNAVPVAAPLHVVDDDGMEATRVGSSSPMTLYDDGESADGGGHRTAASSITEDDLSDRESDAQDSGEDGEDVIITPRFIIKPASQLRIEDLMEEMSIDQRNARMREVQHFTAAVKELQKLEKWELEAEKEKEKEKLVKEKAERQELKSQQVEPSLSETGGSVV